MNELRFQYFCISLQKYSNEVFHFPFLLFFTNFFIHLPTPKYIKIIVRNDNRIETKILFLSLSLSIKN